MSLHRAANVIVTGALIAGLVAFVASCQTQPKDTTGQTPAAVTDSTQLKRLARGNTTYLAYCSMCHGEWGEGDGPLAGELGHAAGVTPARLNDRVRLGAMGRAELVRVIEKGGAHTGRSNLMPPWGERISRENIEEIADFVMSLPDQKPGTPPSVIAEYLAAPPGSAPEGRKLFVQYCVLCHGAEAHGDGLYADTLVARNKIRPRDLTDSLYLAKRTDQQLYVTIALGGAHSGKSQFMPSWGVTIPPNQIKDLLSYVRTISRTAPRP